MGVSQIQIAKACKLDVSSVNKILSHRQGAVFHGKTIKKVFSVAKQLGYDFSKPSKGNLVAVLQELFPSGIPEQDLAKKHGISLQRVAQIKELILRATGAALILITLSAIIGH